MASTGGRVDAFEQVNHVWSMLNSLRENDPEAYRTFIENQMKGVAEFRAPPELHFSLRTEIEGPNKGPLYINICSWNRVPMRQDPSRPLPICAGKLERGRDEGEIRYTVADVALNPAVLQEHEDKSEICMLVLSFAQKHFSMRLSLQYTVVNCSPKSSPDDLYQRLGFRQRPHGSKQPDTASQTPGALLQKIASLRSETQDEDTAAQIICGPAEHKKTNFIEVISTTYVQPQKPQYQLEMKSGASGVPHSLELTVELPKIRSMSDCQLRISKDDVLLEVEGVYYLLLEFPQIINEDTASAIFNKKKRILTLRVDVV
ncbi:PIH1 domain-containing protein 2 [Brachionichthys hirsutus]|uniref:PIH1 domain-containing protein 2 n=1 Tax=Brachionichthys hirsutus TaxID=412623 RepID=UPI0036050B3A